MGLAGVFGLFMAGNAAAGPSGTTLTVTKTADSTLTQTNIYSWTVQKTTPPNQVTYVIPQGQNAPVGFTITATRTGPVTSSSSSVAGSVCVTNTGSATTEGLHIIDTLEYLDGATWTPVVGGQVIVPVGAELPPSATPVCFPYEIDGLNLDTNLQYRNLAAVSIDNYNGHEGTSFETDAIVPVAVTPTVVTIGQNAALADQITCPAGFTCTPGTLPTTLSGSDTLSYSLTLANTSAACGQTLTLTNTALLTPDQGSQLSSAASVQVFTGTCPVTAYSGRAWDAGVTTPLLGITLGDTGSLSPSGTPSLSSSLASGSIPGILSFGIATGSASSTATSETTNASVAGLTLGVGPLVSITADLIQSQGTSSCVNGVATSLGSSTITNLKINGVSVTITGAANQVVSLPLGLGSITINEQTISGTQPHSQIIVNALDVEAAGIISATIAHSESDITCTPVNPQ